MKDPNNTNNKEQQQRMQEVLLGGRGQKKRLYAVDEEIYGTEEGAKLQKEATTSAVDVDGGKIINKKRKKKRKKKRDVESEEENAEGGATDTITTDTSVRLKQSVAGVVVAGTLAAGISMLLGGKRSQ